MHGEIGVLIFERLQIFLGKGQNVPNPLQVPDRQLAQQERTGNGVPSADGKTHNKGNGALMFSQSERDFYDMLVIFVDNVRQKQTDKRIASSYLTRKQTFVPLYVFLRINVHIACGRGVSHQEKGFLKCCFTVAHD